MRSSRRRTLTIVLAIAFALVIATQFGDHRWIKMRIVGLLGDEEVIASSPPDPKLLGAAPLLSQRPNSDVKVHRFNKDHIAISGSVYGLSDNKLSGLKAADLEKLLENVVEETTANCSTVRRLNVKAKSSGGWDVCLTGPFKPQVPCISFSFGVDSSWQFEDGIVETIGCQVFAFDPNLPQQESHVRSARVAFLKEGLHASKSSLNSWPVDSYLGYLKRFGAENYVIDILKLDIESSEWAALETAVQDGSLKNVKQLMLTTHSSQSDTEKEFRRYLAVLRALHDLGFRLWRHNANTKSSYESRWNKDLSISCCHDLHYININFLSGSRPTRIKSDTEIVVPRSQFPDAKISKAAGYSQADEILRLDMTGKSHADLENIYFNKVAAQVHLNCPYNLRVGLFDDGGYDLCFLEPFNIQNSKPCVVFSIGTNYMWSFDDTLADKYQCKVYMFDPSMTKVSDHQRKNTSWFFKIGLSSENTVMPNGWKMRTLCTLFNDLGYGNKTVDILKIDIENWEWTSLEKALEEGCLKNVKQFVFEAHTHEVLGKKSDYSRFIRIWQGLYRQNFRMWRWFKNPLSVTYKSSSPPYQQRACCYDQCLLNTRFLNL